MKNKIINNNKTELKLQKKPYLVGAVSGGSGVYEHNYWEEDGKSWYQYIHTFEIYRQKDKNYFGKSFKHKRCPFCQRITSMATLHWYSHLNKCSPKEYSMADIGELRYRKTNELRGQRIGR